MPPANAPTYKVFAGFVSQTWADLAAQNLDWSSLVDYNWPDLIGGAIPTTDVVNIDIRREVSDVFGRLQEGQCDIILDNEAGLYSPDNNASPFDVRPGEVIAVKAVSTQNSVYGLFSGVIDEVMARTEIGQRQWRLRCVDGSRQLNRVVNVPMLFNTNVNSAAAAVLQQLPANAVVTNIDPSLTDPIPFAFMDKISAGDAFDQLAKFGAHYLYFDGNNQMTMRSRNYDVALTAAASYSNASAPASGATAGYSFEYALTTQDVINDALIAGQPRAPLGLVTSVAAIGQVATLRPNQATTFQLTFRDPATGDQPTPVRSLATPVNSVDYMITADQRGSTSNVGNSFGITLVAAAETANVTIVNTFGSPYFLQSFFLNGDPVVKRSAIQAESEDVDSQGRFGIATMRIDNDLLFDPVYAGDMAAYLVDRRKVPLTTPKLSLRNDYPNAYALDLLQAVNIQETVTGVASLFVIESVEHQIEWSRDTGQVHTAIFGLRMFETKTWLILDSATRGILDTNTLGF